MADIGAEADLAGLDAAAADDELLRAADQQVHVQAEVRCLPSLLKTLDSDRHVGHEDGLAQDGLWQHGTAAVSVLMLRCTVVHDVLCTGGVSAPARKPCSHTRTQVFACFPPCAGAVSSGADAAGCARRRRCAAVWRR